MVPFKNEGGEVESMLFIATGINGLQSNTGKSEE